MPELGNIMNARIPLQATAADITSLPPYEKDTVRFRVTVEGVTLDTLIYYDDDFGVSVAAIWHRGVNVAPLLEQSIDEPIIVAYKKDCATRRDAYRVESLAGFSS